MRKPGFILAAMALLAASPADAETALEMRSHCSPAAAATILPDGQIHMASSFPAGVCWGAFSALQQLSRLADGDDRVLYFCPPETSTRLQLVKVFVKYVDDHPENSHEDWVMVGLKALQAAFPCK